MSTLTKESVSKLVQDRLRHDPNVGSRVRVIATDVRLGDKSEQWWWVPVEFQTEPTKLYYYYELFSSVEEQLEESEHVNVLIVPRVSGISEAGAA